MRRLLPAMSRGPLRAFQRLHLTTKLLLMMGVLTVLSLGSVFVFYAYNERMFIREITASVSDLSSAIQVSVEELTSHESTSEGRLQDYVGRLAKKGVKEISIISNAREVIASSNPQRVGLKINPRRKDLFITARLGEGGAEGAQTHNLLVPIVVGNQQVGYAHIMLVMDDYTRLLRENLVRRLMVTGGIFGLGIGLVLFLAWRYTRPIYQVVDVAKQVAAGNLSATLPEERGDEIGELIASVNEMVKKLREQRVLEERLQDAQRFSALGELAAGIAHEIRNPLNFISLSIDRVRDVIKRDEHVRSEEIPLLLGSIKNEVFRLNRMVDSFLRHGQPVKLVRRWVCLREVLDDVAALVRQKTDEARVQLSVDGPDAVRCFIDPEQIKTCVMNIVINALQAMPDGGRLEIRMTPETDAVEARFVRLEVGDTGVGIAEENLRRVFHPYFTTKPLGIGLGLALTKQIIEEHGGSITIDSEVGQGTTVSVRLPMGPEEEGA